MRNLLVVMVLLLVFVPTVSASQVADDLLKEHERFVDNIFDKSLRKSQENRARLDEALEKLDIEKRELDIRIETISQFSPPEVKIESLDDIINFNVDEFEKEIEAKLDREIQEALSQTD